MTTLILFFFGWAIAPFIFLVLSLLYYHIGWWITGNERWDVRDPR